MTPQLYVRERLVGGLEVVRELHEQGKLKELLEYVPPKMIESIGDRFKSRFNKAKVKSDAGDGASPGNSPALPRI